MSGKVKTGHWELAICLAVPPLVILAMILAGFVYSRQQERLLAQRAGLMNLVPVLEQRADAAHKALKPFVVPGVPKDMAADLSLCVSDAAQKYGFAVRTSTVEKQAGSGAGAWTDYKLTLSGEGSLTSLIAMLDYLGQPQRRFSAVHVSLATTRLNPETMCSADLVLVSRVVADRNGDADVGQARGITEATAKDIGEKVGKATDGVMAWLAEPVVPVSLKNLQSRVLYVPPTQTVQAGIEPQVSFRLTGVVRDKNCPMIMTDRGVFGVGDVVDGFKVEFIGEDKVSVVSKSGRRETVRMYKGGGGL